MSKTILVTGSTDGIGKLAAIRYAKEGNQVLVHGRNEDKLNKTLSEIKIISGNYNVSGLLADFSDLNSVNEMASRIKEKYDHIDVLVNNAGIFNSTSTKTKQGFDIRFVVNYLAPYILTDKLLPLLTKSDNGRIVNLSSAAQSSINYDAMFGNINVSDKDAYAQSKLALTMWSFHLSNQLNNISVIAVNPGSLLDTKMAKEAFGQIWSPAEKGVDIIYDLSLSEKYKYDSGNYFDNDQGGFSKAHPDVYNENQIEKLIKTTNTILSKFEIQ